MATKIQMKVMSRNKLVPTWQEGTQ